MTLDLTSYQALSFDCYGTLIDWEAGIAAVLAPWAREQGLEVTEEDLLLAYADHEAAVERRDPDRALPRGPRRGLPAYRREPGQPGQRRVGAPARRLGAGLAARSRTRRRRSPASGTTTG